MRIKRAKKKWKKKMKGAFLIGSVLLPCMVLLMLWSLNAERETHYTPVYDKVDLTEYSTKQVLSPADYEVIFCQTGLGKAAVDELWSDLDGEVLPEAVTPEWPPKERIQSLKFLQERFFAKTDIRCESNTILTRQEELVNMPRYTADWRECYPFLQDGDILITFCCHFFGWRNGHAGIVVDAENGLILEARSLGSNSVVASLSGWTRYPSVAVLRLKDAPKEVREEIADYAREHYNDLPYRLSAGILPEVEGTQCAHLVYAAYREFGYDIDADKGVVVTPRDLFESPQLEVVQIYGMDPSEYNLYF